jgi:hypothetical protein
VVSEIRVTNYSANREAAVRKPFDLVERQSVDVHHRLRLLDIQLHQIDERCAAADEANLRALLRCGRFGCCGNSLSAIAGPRELESFHPGFCGLAFCRTL